MEKGDRQKFSLWRRLLTALSGEKLYSEEARFSTLEKDVKSLHKELKRLGKLLAAAEKAQIIRSNDAVERVRKTISTIDSKRAKQYATFLSCFVDITAAPPARGLLRKKQIVALQTLRVMDKLFRRHGVRYWLDYGTLLGARRHKGFIPWDDDLDVGVLRSDYEKIESLAHDFTAHNCELWMRHKFGNIFFRVSPKDYRSCALDLFPYDVDEAIPDVSDSKLNLGERMKAGWAYRKEWVKPYMNKDDGFEYSLFRKNLRDYMNNIFYQDHPAPLENEAGAVFLGIEFNPFSKPLIYDRETVLPLGKEMLFEGYSFCVPNRVEDYLKIPYGDYMAFPGNFLKHGVDQIGNMPRNIDELTESIRDAVQEIQ